FQAEDGIRDWSVTGVQTCALPISLIDIPSPQMTFVHVHPGVEELGRVYRPHLGINATPASFAVAAAALDPPAKPRWDGVSKAAHDDYLAFSEKPTDVPGGVNLCAILVLLADHLPHH